MEMIRGKLKLSGDTNIIRVHSWKTEIKTLENRYKLDKDTKLQIENKHRFQKYSF